MNDEPTTMSAAARHDDRAAPAWPWWLLLLGALALPLLVAPPLATNLHWAISSTVTRLMMLFVGIVILAWIRVLRPSAVDWRTIFAAASLRRVGLALAITIAICAGYSTALVLLGAETLRPMHAIHEPRRLLTGLLTGLAVSAIEEPVFRRLLLRKLAVRGSIVVGAILSSALYSLAHYLRPEKPPMQASYSIADSARVYAEIGGNLLEPFRDPLPGLALFLLGLFLCAVVRRGGLAWTIGIHSGVVYYVKADSCLLYWNPVGRHPLFGSFDVLYDGALFCIVCGFALLVFFVAQWLRRPAAGASTVSATIG